MQAISRRFKWHLIGVFHFVIAFLQDVVYNTLESRCSAVGSAPALGAGCREFESRHLDHNPKDENPWDYLFSHFGKLR